MVTRRTFLRNAAGVFVPAVVGLGQEMIYLPHRRKAFSGGFIPRGTNLDGSQFLTHSGNLSGVANGLVGAVSFWMRRNANTTQYWYTSTYSTINCYVSSGFFVVTIQGTVSGRLRLQTTNQTTETSNWHHIAFSWDCNSLIYCCYVDGTSRLDSSGTITPVSTALNYRPGNHWLFSNDGVTGSVNAAVGEIYVNLAEYIDFSSSTVLEKFRSSTGHPCDLGADGSIPTGTAPAIYLHSPYSSFGVNSGTGGNFTLTGTPTDGGKIP